MRSRFYAFIIGVVAAACMVTCSDPSSAESQSSLRGWMLYTPDVLCWTTPAAEVICSPPKSAVIVRKFDFYLQAKQANVIPENTLFSDGFENLP